MEEVLADWSATAVGPIVLAAISAVVTMRAFLGNQPLFQVPVFELANVSELLIYAAIGVIGGALSALFIGSIESVKPRLASIPHWRHYVLPIGAGFLTGVVGLWFPEVMGAGYDALNSALHGQFVWAVLVYLALANPPSLSLHFWQKRPAECSRPLCLPEACSVAAWEAWRIVSGPWAPRPAKRISSSGWARFSRAFSAHLSHPSSWCLN